MTDYARLLAVLSEGGVEFGLIGGVAAVVHGSARFTQDLDVVYERSPENFGRLSSALSPLHPYLRGAPPGLPFRWDAATIERGLNFTLTTDAGDLDLFGEITGGGRWPDLEPHLETVEIFGHPTRVLALRKLIEVKRAAGRPKDLEAIAELEAILSARQ